MREPRRLMLHVLRRPWRGGLLLVVAASALVAAPAGAGAAERAAVVGAALELRGAALDGRGLRVTVGGKRARTFRAGGRLRFVVPKLRPGVRTLVVRKGRRLVSARLRVLRRFRGRVTVEADRRRAEGATIGPAGGAVTARGADGTRYTLRVPPGGLASDRRITLTPVLRFGGLPFTGGRVAGVEFAPDGLRFGTPATLEIEPRRALPANSTGFAYAPGTSGFEVEPAKRAGGVVTLRIEHFSSSGVGAITEADFANVVGPIISRPGPLSESQIRSIIGLMAEWSARFDRPPSYFFCAAQPICEQARLKALESLGVLAADVCAQGRAHPTLGSVHRLIELEFLRQQVGAEDSSSQACQTQILASMIGLATFAARSDPRGVPPFEHELPVGFGDIDADGTGANWEVLLELAAFAFESGFDDLGSSARADALSILRDIPEQGRIRCSSDRDDAVDLLLKARRWAELRDEDSLAGFDAALDFCRLAIQATPSQTTVAPGGEQRFTATVTGLVESSSNAGVTWSASRGSIDTTGRYTAPSTPGPDQVTATSVLNPSRTATSAVTVTGAGYDLSVTITEGPDPAPSGTIRYDYAVTNHGPGVARGASLHVTPAVALGWPTCPALQAETRSLGDLEPGATVTGTYDVSCDGPGMIRVEMRAAAAAGETVPGDNVTSKSTDILPPVDERNALNLTFQAPGGCCFSVPEGDSTWTVQVAASPNANPLDTEAENVQVAFEVTIEKPCCGVWATTTCTTPGAVALGDIAAGSSTTVSFNVTCFVADDGNGFGVARVKLTLTGSDGSRGEGSTTQPYRNVVTPGA